MSTHSTRSYIEAYKFVGKDHIDVMSDQMRCTAGRLFDEQKSREHQLQHWLQEGHLWFMMGDISGPYVPDKDWREPKSYGKTREEYAKALNIKPINGEHLCAEPYRSVFGDYERYVKASHLCAQKQRFVRKVMGACTADISGGNYLTAIPPTLILALAWRSVIDWLMMRSHRHAGFYAGLALCSHDQRYVSLWDNMTSDSPADDCMGHPVVRSSTPNNWVSQIVNAVAWFDEVCDRLVPETSLLGSYGESHFKAMRQTDKMPKMEDIVYQDGFFCLPNSYDEFKYCKRTGELTQPTVTETRNFVNNLRAAVPFVPDWNMIEEYVPTHSIKYRYKHQDRRAAPALAYRKALAMAPTVADEIVDNIFDNNSYRIMEVARLVDQFAKLKQFCMRNAVAESSIPLPMIETQFNTWAIQTAIRPCGFYCNGGSSAMHKEKTTDQPYQAVYYSHRLGPINQPAYIPLRFTDYQTQVFDLSPTQQMPPSGTLRKRNDCMLVAQCGVDFYDDMDTDILWKCRVPYMANTKHDADKYYGGRLRPGKVDVPKIKKETTNV